MFGHFRTPQRRIYGSKGLLTACDTLLVFSKTKQMSKKMDVWDQLGRSIPAGFTGVMQFLTMFYVCLAACRLMHELYHYDEL